MDKELIKRARDGDKKAFAQIFNDDYIKELYGIAIFRLKDDADTRDAIQDTLIEAYRNIYTIKDILKFKCWVRAILINKCMDILRDKNWNVISYSNEIKFMNEDCVEDDFITIEDKMDFFNLIEILDDEEKDIIFLTMRGYTSKTISKIMNINDNTVRTKLSRAKQKLKNEYKRGD